MSMTRTIVGIYVEDSNPFRYCAEYYDGESEFIYLRARYYSPDLQRFISEDPIRDGNNWYAYCGNNPIMIVDPLGLAKNEWNVDLDDIIEFNDCGFEWDYFSFGADVDEDNITPTIRIYFSGTNDAVSYYLNPIDRDMYRAY